jgi:hypothetical protein
MEDQQFDDLVRIVSRSRRTLLGLSTALWLGLGAALGLAPLTADARKRKKKKKKNKKCRGNTKKCGKRCIPQTSCCASADCGPNNVCVNNQCQCAPGLRPCNGTCISQEKCCGDAECGGDLVCINNACACPEDVPVQCPEQACVSGAECCISAQCFGEQDTCVDGFCVCPEDTISCLNLCCDPDAEICAAQPNDQSMYEWSCQAGGCPAIDHCISDNFYLCQNDPSGVCACTTTTDLAPQNACIATDLNLEVSCGAACTTSADCPAGHVCIRDGAYCGCGHDICAPLCESGIPRSAPARGATGVGGGMLTRRRISR